ncbi:MAG: DUF4352 domain-containing protein, partial [Clostridiaceae bacterium]|nr:DUF4352 domain-containing protein [Clostridiaceae bacterium]
VKNEIPSKYKNSVFYNESPWHEKEIDAGTLVWYSEDQDICKFGAVWLVTEKGIFCENGTAMGLTPHLNITGYASNIDYICPEEKVGNVYSTEQNFISQLKEKLEQNNIQFIDVSIVDNRASGGQKQLGIFYKSRQPIIDEIPISEVASISVFFADLVKQGLDVDVMIAGVNNQNNKLVGSWRCDKIWVERFNDGTYTSKDLMNISYSTVKVYETYNIKVTIDKSKSGLAPQYLSESTQYPVKAGLGKTYMLLWIKVTNNSCDNSVSTHPWGFSITINNVEYSPSTYIGQHGLPIVDLHKGGSSEGYLLFEIPYTESVNYSISYKPLALPTDYCDIAIVFID